MKRPIIFAAVIGLMAVALALGVAGGFLLQTVLAAGPRTSAPPASGKLNAALIDEAYNLIRQRYVDQESVKSEKLTYGAISGMVESLGDTGHTTFLTPEMVRTQQNYQRGEFEGIGAQVEARDGHVVVAAPLDNSPAQRAGLKPGDIFVRVDGEDVTGMTLQEVVQRVSGPAGTTVTLVLRDPETQQTRELTIRRAKIDVPSVSWTMVPGTSIAHIRLAAFSENAGAELEHALDGARAVGASGLILDLRNNPGGLLEEAVQVTSRFLHDGLVLQEKDAQGKVSKVEVRKDTLKTNLPMVVLINQGSASASEIVSGALQDQKRATLVGETTFGTGTVLSQFPLSDGSAIMLAVKEWLTPNGRVIWHQGIRPDVAVELPANETPLAPQREESMTPEQLNSTKDTQFLKALEIVQGESVTVLKESAG